MAASTARRGLPTPPGPPSVGTRPWADTLRTSDSPRARPHTARGANNGIEQAAALAAALTQHRKYRADLTAALHGWQRRHLPAAVAQVAAHLEQRSGAKKVHA